MFSSVIVCAFEKIIKP